jgi:hypothetical protein
MKIHSAVLELLHADRQIWRSLEAHFCMPDRSKVMGPGKKGHPGPPGWGFGVGLMAPPREKFELL